MSSIQAVQSAAALTSYKPAAQPRESTETPQVEKKEALGGRQETGESASASVGTRFSAIA